MMVVIDPSLSVEHDTNQWKNICSLRCLGGKRYMSFTRVDLSDFYIIFLHIFFQKYLKAGSWPSRLYQKNMTALSNVPSLQNIPRHGHVPLSARIQKMKLPCHGCLSKITLHLIMLWRSTEVLDVLPGNVPKQRPWLLRVEKALLGKDV